MKEEMKATWSEIKENVQGTNSEGKETGTQINDLEQKEEINIQLEQNKKTRIQKKKIGELFPHRTSVVRVYVYWNTETSTADPVGRDLRHPKPNHSC